MNLAMILMQHDGFQIAVLGCQGQGRHYDRMALPDIGRVNGLVHLGDALEAQVLALLGIDHHLPGLFGDHEAQPHRRRKIGAAGGHAGFRCPFLTIGTIARAQFVQFAAGNLAALGASMPTR